MTNKEPYVQNTADTRQVRKAKQKVRSDERSADLDLGVVLSTVNGRRFIWNLLSDCGVFEISFVQGQSDLTAFNEGGRNVGNKLLTTILKAHTKAYHLMAEEDRKREEQ